MIQKQGNWVPYELKPRDVERQFFTCEQLIQSQQKRFFCIGLWLEMRSEYSTTTSRRKNTTLSPINRYHRPQHQHHSQTFMVRISCSVSDGTKRVLLLWTAETWRFHYGRSVSATMITLSCLCSYSRPFFSQCMAQTNQSSSWQRSASCR